MRTLILLASVCLVGGGLEAQGMAQARTRAPEEARRIAETVVLQDGAMKRTMVIDSAAMNRATLGVSLGGTAHKRDTLGVFVEAVAEGGPAERAGIYEGHRIASINNVDVRASSADAGDAYLSSVGMHRLMRAMRDVSAGSTVSLRVWTGSGYRDVQLTAGRFSDVYKNQRLGGMFGDGTLSSFSFAPMEAMHLEGPMLRERHLQPSRKVRVEVRPGQQDKVTEVRPAEPRSPLRGAMPTPRTPRTLVAPSVVATPNVISVPGVAPTPRGTRRYTI